MAQVRPSPSIASQGLFQAATAEVRHGVSLLKKKLKDHKALSKRVLQAGAWEYPSRIRKIPAPIKIKSALPSPPQTQNTPPPPKRGILWT